MKSRIIVFAIYEKKISFGKTIESEFIELANEFDAEDVSLANCDWYEAKEVFVQMHISGKKTIAQRVRHETD